MSEHMIVGDLHAAETPPGRRDLNYFADCLAKLDQIVELSARFASTIFIGDLFHSKRANHVSHRLVLELAARIEKMGDVWILPGNHDLADGSLGSLSRQPLSSLALLPNVTIMDEPPGTVYEIAGDAFLAVPGTGEVCDAKEEALEWFHSDEWVNCVLAHAPISVESKPWPTWHPTDLPLPESCQMLVYGHQHDKAGLKLDDPHTLATGAVMRGAISEARNEPAVVSVELGEHVGGTVHPLACRPATEVYRWEERAAEKAANEAMDEFIESIGTTKIHGFSVDDLIHRIRTNTDVPEEISESAIAILESL